MERTNAKTLIEELTAGLSGRTKTKYTQIVTMCLTQHIIYMKTQYVEFLKQNVIDLKAGRGVPDEKRQFGEFLLNEYREEGWEEDFEVDDYADFQDKFWLKEDGDVFIDVKEMTDMIILMLQEVRRSKEEVELSIFEDFKCIFLGWFRAVVAKLVWTEEGKEYRVTDVFYLHTACS